MPNSQKFLQLVITHHLELTPGPCLFLDNTNRIKDQWVSALVFPCDLLNLPGYSGMRHFITSLPRTHCPLAFFFFLTKKKNIRRNTAKPSSSLFFTAQEGEDLLEVTWWISNEARLPIHPPPRQHSFFYIPFKKKKGCALVEGVQWLLEKNRTSLLSHRGKSVSVSLEHQGWLVRREDHQSHWGWAHFCCGVRCE